MNQVYTDYRSVVYSKKTRTPPLPSGNLTSNNNNSSNNNNDII